MGREVAGVREKLAGWKSRVLLKRSGPYPRPAQRLSNEAEAADLGFGNMLRGWHVSPVKSWFCVYFFTLLPKCSKHHGPVKMRYLLLN